MIRSPRIRLTFLLIVNTVISSQLVWADDRVDFNRDIRPILSENCFYCHGFDEDNREAGLRLDTFDGATEGGAIEPGEPDSSELVRRMLSDDPDEVMPPPETEKELTVEEIDLIQRWIKQGAVYQQHWAWSPLRRPTVPASDSTTSAESPHGAAAIDAFLRAGWESEGVKPVALASPRERLRRLSFDLRGLSPTADEVAEYEQTPTDRKLFQFRDRWMSELPYAEHQAVRWLDLVRWADTSGFVSDEPIASGAYRAWIIDAIRQNMPFDQFSIEQLAGDLLPDPSDRQLIASGYNRIVNTNCEAGAIEEEQLYKLKGEHVRALGTVWMGMTTGCAECHDHKFDPFSAKDYYSLAAFFDDLVEAGVYTPGDRREPLHYVHDDDVASRRDQQLVLQIAELRKQIGDRRLDDIETWQKETLADLNDKESRGDFVWIPGLLPAMRVLEGNFSLAENDGKTVRETVAQQRQFRRHHAAELMTGWVTGMKTDGSKDAWFVDVWIDPDDRPDMVGLQISEGKYGRLGWRTANYHTYYWGEDTSGELSKTQTWNDPKRVKRVGDLPDQSGWVRLRITLDQLLKPVGGQAFEATGMAWLQSGGRVRWGASGLELRTDKVTSLRLGETGVRRWWEKPKNRQIYQRRVDYVASALRKAESQRDGLQESIVLAAYREQTQRGLMSQLRELESELFRLRSRAMPVLVSRQAEKRKTTRLLHRGDYQDKSGPIMSPEVPEFIGGGAGGSTRLELAQWLFSEDNPLIARVFVNRLWHQFYGRGISETLEDSGTQGDWPSNLALLDWLACEFRSSGWDRNHMVRLLTSTRAYQLSSTPTTDLLRRDPGNRWHARQGRYRHTAETIRDSALAAAGLLKSGDSVPLQSFFPYQPEPYWTVSDKIMYGSRHMIWETSVKRAQYHRSIYTFWKRQNIHPTMLAFDAPTRQECTAKRNITNTPGQALALLNDPIFVEAARVFAIRICSDAGSSDVSKVERAFQIALQRKPKANERDVLISLLARQRTFFEQHHGEAEALTAIGQTPPPPPETAVEVAAWTVVTRTILNLHEFLNRS